MRLTPLVATLANGRGLAAPRGPAIRDWNAAINALRAAARDKSYPWEQAVNYLCAFKNIDRLIVVEGDPMINQLVDTLSALRSRANSRGEAAPLYPCETTYRDRLIAVCRPDAGPRSTSTSSNRKPTTS